MKSQVLSIEQMQHLIELGVDTSKASMCGFFNSDTPTFTTHDLLELLPHRIMMNGENLYVSIQKFSNKWQVRYSSHKEIVLPIRIVRTSLIDALYETLCWLAKNDLLNEKEEEEL